MKKGPNLFSVTKERVSAFFPSNPGTFKTIRVVPGTFVAAGQIDVVVAAGLINTAGDVGFMVALHCSKTSSKNCCLLRHCLVLVGMKSA